jgi:hypothetical protein
VRFVSGYLTGGVAPPLRRHGDLEAGEFQNT